MRNIQTTVIIRQKQRNPCGYLLDNGQKKPNPYEKWLKTTKTLVIIYWTMVRKSQTPMELVRNSQTLMSTRQKQPNPIETYQKQPCVNW